MNLALSNKHPWPCYQIGINLKSEEKCCKLNYENLLFKRKLLVYQCAHLAPVQLLLASASCVLHPVQESLVLEIIHEHVHVALILELECIFRSFVGRFPKIQNSSETASARSRRRYFNESCEKN